VPALADVMVRIAEDRQLRAHYAIAARELVVEKFAADIIGRQTVQLYRSLLETGGITQ
jgi:glycosyltransferase involved in cell wall biosynthesis